MPENQYNRKDTLSIYNYSKRLITHCLREFAPDADEPAGKGGLAQLVEKLYFGYDVNSCPEADFAEAGLELKCTPLKRNKEEELCIKERLVCGMINYREDWDKSFENSHFYKKCLVMLLLFYLHQGGVSRLNLEFVYSVLWKIPEKDLLIMKNDYEKIICKIEQGLAHTLSEGDTMYLGACRKGQDAGTVTQQHGSAILAPTRAWCLKMAYMRTVLEEVKQKQINGAYSNFEYSPTKNLETLTKEEELRNQTFDEVILNRFAPYMQKDYEEFCRLAGRIATASKQKYFIMANSIAGASNVSNINHSEEFLKAGITMKTIRVQKSGRVKESMSFENIDYKEVCDCGEWYDSRLYELFSSRFLFVVFKETEGEITLGEGAVEPRYVLDDVFFWTMPVEDLDVAELYWKNIRQCVINDTISAEYFWKIDDKKYFHVRPKGKNSHDYADNPNGGSAPKYCYWFNSEYVRNILEKRHDTI